jgi:hypothetical protein
MGLASWYMRFIASFCKIAYLITSLQNKGIQLKWTTKYEESFQHLKYLLTSGPILKVADLDEDFFVCTNACKEGLGVGYVLYSFASGNMSHFCLIFCVASILMSIVGRFFGTWFLSMILYFRLRN